jgi:Xaa-Pro aminopeptidase
MDDVMKSLVEWSARNRDCVIQAVTKTLPSSDEPWVLVLVNDFESHRDRFRSESSFYYLTGLTEPAVMVCVFSDGRTVLYRPNYSVDREVWTGVKFPGTNSGFTDIQFLGERVSGYSMNGTFQPEHYASVGKELASLLSNRGTLFVIHDTLGNRYKAQSELLSAIVDTFDISYREVRDISPIVHALRREKHLDEIALMYDAAQITVAAQNFVTKAMKSGVFEYEIRGALESVFTMFGSERPAFPTIVATGANSTRLHYTQGVSPLSDGDLVVIDCGAEYHMYCADVTRTYPVSGLFTPRQKEVYELVLKVQKTIESMVRPGMFLRSAEFQDISLHHIAVKLFKDAGVDQYFKHSLGHYLGLDVHDVGDYGVPLGVGDAFTLEPGLYFPEEHLGVRIEDDYVLTEDGVVCLTDTLPKEVDDIELLLAQKGDVAS